MERWLPFDFPFPNIKAAILIFTRNEGVKKLPPAVCLSCSRQPLPQPFISSSLFPPQILKPHSHLYSKRRIQKASSRSLPFISSSLTSPLRPTHNRPEFVYDDVKLLYNRSLSSHACHINLWQSRHLRASQTQTYNERDVTDPNVSWTKAFQNGMATVGGAF